MKTALRVNRPTPTAVTTVIIGAGQAGLAMSRCLAQRSIGHVLLERGQVGNSWHNERWESLRTLTPNWQNQLPGYDYRGSDPQGFMRAAEFGDYLDDYAAHMAAPVRCNTTVTSVQANDEGYLVGTNKGEWLCKSVVIASGACNLPCIPKFASAIPESVATLHCSAYRNPDQLAKGGVLIVGASATGLQLASEIRASGRAITLAVGEHVRLPRHYRGKDILWWMDKTGLLDESYQKVDDLNRVRRLPSAQLVGNEDHASLDLNVLRERGVRMVGRLAAVSERGAQFSGSLANICKMADLKLGRLLDSADRWAEVAGLGNTIAAPQRYQPTRMDDVPTLAIDWQEDEITTVIWATGYRPDYSWLHLPVLDRKGGLMHDGGVVKAPGVYAMGLPFMRKRKSSFIYGAGDDAEALSEYLEQYLLNSQWQSSGFPQARPTPIWRENNLKASNAN